MDISIESLLKKVTGLEPEGLQLKKDYNSCFPVKFLRAPDFKEHLRTNACESKPHGKVSFKCH